LPFHPFDGEEGLEGGEEFRSELQLVAVQHAIENLKRGFLVGFLGIAIFRRATQSPWEVVTTRMGLDVAKVSCPTKPWLSLLT